MSTSTPAAAGFGVEPGLAYSNLVGLANIAQVVGHLEAVATLLGAEDAYRALHRSLGRVVLGETQRAGDAGPS